MDGVIFHRYRWYFHQQYRVHHSNWRPTSLMATTLFFLSSPVALEFSLRFSVSENTDRQHGPFYFLSSLGCSILSRQSIYTARHGSI